jgi:hypothetical protein
MRGSSPVKNIFDYSLQKLRETEGVSSSDFLVISVNTPALLSDVINDSHIFRGFMNLEADHKDLLEVYNHD